MADETSLYGEPSGLQPAKADPTQLTLDVLHRESLFLKELIFTRLDAMDKAVALFSTNLTRVPTDVDKQVGNLKELLSERFNRVTTQFEGIQLQFIERDVRTEKSAEDSKIAVDAALQAAKEAVGKQQESNSLAISKSEGATTKQLDQINVNLQTINAALNDKIDDVKNRLTIQDGKGLGAGALWGVIATAAGIVIAVMAIYVGSRNGKNESQVTPPAPPIIYVQPPPAAAPPVVIQPGPGGTR
jgi:hypothetical protein